MNSQFFFIFNKSLKDYKLCGIEVMLCFLLVTVSCVLILFTPSIPLFMLALIYFCIGVSKFVLGVIRNNKIIYENIFPNIKILIIAFCSKTLSFIISFLWSLLFIFPGILSLINFSFVSMLIADGEKNSLEALSKSKVLTKNVRFEIFLYYLLCVLFIIVCACASFGVLLLINYFISTPLWLDLCLGVGLTILPVYLFVLPFTKLCIANLYIEQKSMFDKLEKSNKKVATKA